MHSLKSIGVLQDFREGIWATDGLKWWQKQQVLKKLNVSLVLYEPVGLIKADANIVTLNLVFVSKFTDDVYSFYFRKTNAAWPAHTALSSAWTRRDPFEKDEPQGKGHKGACADWKGLSHWLGTVHQRSGAAFAKFAGKRLSEPLLKSLVLLIHL